METSKREEMLKKSFARAANSNNPLSSDQKDFARIYRDKMLEFGRKHDCRFTEQEVDDYIKRQFYQVNSLHGNETPHYPDIHRAWEKQEPESKGEVSPDEIKL